MALDLTCLTIVQPNSMACRSSSDGRRLVATRHSAAETIFVSRSWTRKDSAPTSRTSAEPPPGHLRAFIRRRFFLRRNKSSASAVKSGATITSLKISAMASAQGRSSGWLTTIIPPKGACLSVAKAFSQASRSVLPWAAPQGLECLRMARVGAAPANSAARAAAAVKSRILLKDNSRPCSCWK